MRDLRFVDLGRMAYAEALRLQRAELERTIAERPAAMTVFLVEHDPPVVTVSRRPAAESHLLASAATLARLGVQVEPTDRGGDITYHGPGQLVVYPILDLNRLGLRIHSYMRFLEEVVIDVLAQWGIVGHRDACATGVWVGGGQAVPAGSDPGPTAPTGGAKICAMGVRVSRWVSMHGFALNVDPDLSHFELIVPCGLAGRRVTSMARELGAGPMSMDDVKSATRRALAAAVERAMAATRP
ncbi:MAG: lipoyl(octanoyl) transferase LipB [Phycisphaerales bacterium]|nr:lipoyl(octanoyl) transferase LipB [Phycisphaerales bacterium]